MPSEARATEQVAPKELQVQPEHIPAELRRYAQWICWRYVDRGEGKKPDKQPVNPHNLHNAGVHWPNTWTNFEHAYMTYLAYRSRGLRGIGFVLTADDPFVGVDLDHCVADGKVAPEAQVVVDHLASYTETSPSSQGLRILVTSPGFAGNNRRQALEIYSYSRFVTLTGHHLEGTPATIATVEAKVIGALIPQEDTPKSPLAPPHSDRRPHDLDGMVLWERIFEHAECVKYFETVSARI